MFLIWSLVLLVTSRSSLGFSDPVVVTPLGQVRGWESVSRDGRVYQAWTGIPYAQPPVGELRFKAPKPPQKWEGVLNATNDMPICLQKMPTLMGSEDCLYLSVYRPKVTPAKEMPVLFHIHGGAFLWGSIGPRENAEYLMDEDVILVNIHYRLGPFGFFGLGDKVMPGNFGLKDQVMALKWVKENIKAFGGNPNRVTVFGESAGGISSHILLKSPATEDIVQQAMSDSGSMINVGPGQKFYNNTESGITYIKRVGCMKYSSEEILKCLQKANSSALLDAMFPFTINMIFLPCMEPVDAEQAVITEDLSLRPSKKPWIASNVNGEYTLFEELISPDLISALMENYKQYMKLYIASCVGDPDPILVAEGAQFLENVYFTKAPSYENATYQLAKMMADTIFMYPVIFNLRNHAGPKWYYYLEYIGELSNYDSWTGKWGNATVAGHAQQTNYQFNTRSNYPGVSPKQTPDDYKVSKRLIKYLVNFAYYADPTPPGSPMQWDQFTDHEVLRVTDSRSDSQGSQTFYQQFRNVMNVWSYVIGWP